MSQNNRLFAWQKFWFCNRKMWESHRGNQSHPTMSRLWGIMGSNSLWRHNWILNKDEFTRYFQARTCEGYFLNFLRPISYVGVICFMPENQIHFLMDKGLTVPKLCWLFGPKYPKCLIKFQPNLSAQAIKFAIFEKKFSLGVHSPCF